MTGYGSGECAKDGLKVVTEISAVNRKQAEVSTSLPRNLDALESRVREEVNRRVSRGKVNVRINFSAGEDQVTGELRVNRALAKAYQKEFAALAKELGLAGGVSLETILKSPGVVQVDDTASNLDKAWAAISDSLVIALDAMVAMREREGRHLAKDLQARIKSIKTGLQRVKKQAPEVLTRYRAQLLERVKQAGVEIKNEDDERLMKELVFFADRSDISEELTRLDSHFKQFEDCVKSEEPVGRTLDFLAQEMNREVNTIGSKANDAVISREVVFLKTELEKFREQVQNVE